MTDPRTIDALTRAVEKLAAHERWMERRHWCIEKFGPEYKDDRWYWDAIEYKFIFNDPNDELIYKLEIGRAHV